MARHKKIVTEEQGDPEMNISSMIDCCFLLLIYFLVATSLVSEKKIDVSIPGNAASGGTPPPVEPGHIAVSASGEVKWGKDGGMLVGPAYQKAEPGTDAYRDQRSMEDLVENLKALRDQAQAAGSEPIVMVFGDPQAPHQRIVDVMAALAEAGIKTVGLNTASN